MSKFCLKSCKDRGLTNKKLSRPYFRRFPALTNRRTGYSSTCWTPTGSTSSSGSWMRKMLNQEEFCCKACQLWSVLPSRTLRTHYRRMKSPREQITVILLASNLVTMQWKGQLWDPLSPISLTPSQASLQHPDSTQAIRWTNMLSSWTRAQGKELTSTQKKKDAIWTHLSGLLTPLYY